MRPRAVCFDFDSTLIDNGGFRESIRQTCAALAAAHPPLDAAALLAANFEAWSAYWPTVERQWELGGISGREISLEGWRRTLRAVGCEESLVESTAAEAVEVHLQRRAAVVRLFPDTLGILDALTRAGIPLALISNASSDVQRAALRRHGIERHFRAVVISGEHGVAKPDPAIFRIALEQLGLAGDGARHAKDIWHVGDNPLTDVAGAAAAGLTAVWLNRERAPLAEGAPAPDHEIHSLDELMPLLALAGTARA